MRKYKKTLFGIITAMVLAGNMICAAAFAEETPQRENPQQEAPQATDPAAETVEKSVAETAEEPDETTKTFTTEDGVLSIQIPEDDDNWKIIDDQNIWFVISDGKDMITVVHIANGDTLPSVELANDEYEEIYQTFYSTKNEVFIVTGRIANKDEAQTVKDAVNSIQILKYDTILKKETETSEPVYAVKDISETRYCTEKDGVNVRSGYTTDDPIIFVFHYGDQVDVTGIVTKDGEDIGWLRVDCNGQTGYTVGQFYITTAPDTQPEFDGGYAGINYNEDEQGGYAGINYNEDEQGGYAEINYNEDEQGGYAGSNYGD